MTVVKTGNCDTLTKKSKLTYQIGTLPDGEMYFLVHKNSGNGFFSNEWIALADIQKTLAKVLVGKPVTAIMLNERTCQLADSAWCRVSCVNGISQLYSVQASTHQRWMARRKRL